MSRRSWCSAAASISGSDDESGDTTSLGLAGGHCPLHRQRARERAGLGRLGRRLGVARTRRAGGGRRLVCLQDIMNRTFLPRILTLALLLIACCTGAVFAAPND